MWLAGAVLAVIGAAAALSLLGDGVSGPGGKPLTQADVQRALAQSPPATSPSQPGSASPTPRRSHAASPAPVQSTFSSSGGTVFASCSSGQVTLTWIPALGYRTDGSSRGPAASAWVRLKSGATELTITSTCASGRPHFVTSADSRGGGGGDHGGGRGGSGSSVSGGGGGSSGH
jgi:uncharacterized membrane protein YgcG